MGCGLEATTDANVISFQFHHRGTRMKRFCFGKLLNFMVLLVLASFLTQDCSAGARKCRRVKRNRCCAVAQRQCGRPATACCQSGIVSDDSNIPVLPVGENNEVDLEDADVQKLLRSVANIGPTEKVDDALLKRMLSERKVRLPSEVSEGDVSAAPAPYSVETAPATEPAPAPPAATGGRINLPSEVNE